LDKNKIHRRKSFSPNKKNDFKKSFFLFALNLQVRSNSGLWIFIFAKEQGSIRTQFKVFLKQALFKKTLK